MAIIISVMFDPESQYKLSNNEQRRLPLEHYKIAGSDFFLLFLST